MNNGEQEKGSGRFFMDNVLGPFITALKLRAVRMMQQCMLQYTDVHRGMSALPPEAQV